MEKDIAILIPCYNESSTVANVIRDYRIAFPTAKIYVYDNNSTDGTADIARTEGAIVRNCYSQGKGNVVRKMFKDIDADCYIMVDGDDTYPPCVDMVDIILNEKADMVVGDRLSSSYFSENKRMFHGFGNRLVRYLINTLFNVNIKDIMSGSRAFSYSYVKTFPVISKGFEIETEMSIHAAANNLKVLEVPVEYRDRPKGSESKLNTYTDGVKVLKTIMRLFKEYKPVVFFSIVSFVLVLASILLGIPVFIDYFETGLVLRFPTLIFSSFLMTVGILLWISGVILEVIAKKDRKLFEMFYIRTKR